MERHEARREESRSRTQERSEARREERLEERRDASATRERDPGAPDEAPQAVSDAIAPQQALETVSEAIEPPPVPASGSEAGGARAHTPSQPAGPTGAAASGQARRGAGAAVEALPSGDSPPSLTAVPLPSLAAAPTPTGSASSAPSTPEAPAGAGVPVTAARPAGTAADPGAGDPGTGDGEARSAARREVGEAQRPAESARPSVEPAPTTADGRQVSAPRTVEGARAPAPPPAPPPAAPEAAEHAASILNQVRLRLLPGTREATLQLEPARLGRLSIRLELRRGVTRAEVVTEEAATLDVLQRHEPELRAALADAGFEGVEVELRHAGDGERETTFGQRRAPNARPQRAEQAPRELTRALSARIDTDRGVDTYA